MDGERVLQELAEGFTIPLVGNDFFDSLCQSLLKIFEVEYVCIGRLRGSETIETLSYFSREGILPNVEYSIRGTPCEKILEGQRFCHFASNIQERFPKDTFLQDLNIESYSGIPIFDSSHNVIGLMTALSTRPLPDSLYIQNLFRVVSKRVEQEMVRVINEEKLRQNEAQLREAQQIAGMGSFEWEISSDTLIWSDQLYRIFGYEPGEIDINFEVYKRHIHPDYIETVQNDIQEMIQKGHSCDHEYAILDKGGKRKILHSIVKVQSVNGVSEKLLGICHDITKEKEAEKRLMQINSELEERVKKRTESLEKSLLREKLIREISELTLGYLENSERALHEVASKTGSFLSVDGVRIFRVNEGRTYSLTGSYDKDSGANEDKNQVLLSALHELAVGRKSKKNVKIHARSTGDLSPDLQGKFSSQIEALLIMEFFQNSLPYGVLVLYQKQKRKWTDEELVFLEETLNHLGSALYKVDILHMRDHAEAEYLSAQSKLKLITDGMPVFISYLDENLTFQYVNSFYRFFFGVAEKDIIGKNVREILNEKTYERSFPNLQKALSGEEVSFENDLIDAKGNKHEVEVLYIPEKFNGVTKGIIVLGTLITERKRTERRLKEGEERLRLALDASQLGTWDFDLVSDRLIWDERCRKMFGLPKHVSLNYQSFLDQLHPEDKARVNLKVAIALRPKGTGFFDEEFRVRRDSEVWIRSTGQALFRDNKPYRFIGISQDITQSKLAENELKETQRVLEEKNRMLETLQKLGRIISGELEYKKVVQTITDAATLMIGAEFGAFLYNPEIENRQGYHFFSLAGVPFSSFSEFPISNSALFNTTFQSRSVTRYSDLMAEAEGAPKNPYLRSYLAVPVFSKYNKVVGGLFFGHSKPAIFTEESEKIVEGITPQAAIALENARLFEDITELKFMAEQQRNLLYSIFDHAPSLISVCKGKDLVCEFVNKEHEKYFPKGSLIGESIRNRLLEHGQSEFVAVLDKVYETGETFTGKEMPIEIEVEGKKKTGYYDFIIQALRNEKNEIEGIISYATDISDQVYARKTIEEFMSVASHELKTPLTTVMAYSELLEDELNSADPEQKANYIARVNANLGKLNNLISDLLDVSRIQSGKMLFKKAKIDIDEFMRECIDNISYTSKTHTIEVKGYSRSCILGDKGRLEQAIANIISNAIKYSPQADRILVELEVIGDQAVIRFTDFGIGIHSEKMQYLFQRFYRIEEKGTSGLGIGLFITKEIIEGHQGTIHVQSSVGEGSVFTIRLPVER